MGNNNGIGAFLTVLLLVCMVCGAGALGVHAYQQWEDLQAKQAELDTANSTINQLRAELDQGNATIAQMGQQIEQLTQQLQASQSEVSRIAGELQHALAQNAALNQQIQPLNEQIAQLTQQLQEKQGEVNNITSALQQEVDKNGQLNSYLQAQTERITQCSEQVAALEQEINARKRPPLQTMGVELLSPELLLMVLMVNVLYLAMRWITCRRQGELIRVTEEERRMIIRSRRRR